MPPASDWLPKREADRLGAPSPLPGCAVALTTEQDLRAAFSLLDHDRLGELGALQARDFLICAGWCLPEDLLDDALAAVHSKSSLPADARFTFAQLLTALRILKKDKDNISAAALAEALLGVSTEDGLDMGRLQEVVCDGKHPALSLQELGDVLEAVGIYDEELRSGLRAVVLARIFEEVQEEPPSCSSAQATEAVDGVVPKNEIPPPVWTSDWSELCRARLEVQGYPAKAELWHGRGRRNGGTS
eukprot:s3075_g2.t1